MDYIVVAAIASGGGSELADRCLRSSFNYTLAKRKTAAIPEPSFFSMKTLKLIVR
jgi:hypothetical protein